MARALFFYDDEYVQSRLGLHPSYGPVRKLGPLDWQRPAWDLAECSVFAGTILEMPAGGWRLYYSGNAPESGPKFGLAIAESDDGITWTKPALGQILVNRENTNRIVPVNMPDEGSLTQPQVVLMPDGSWLMWAWWHAKEVGYFRYLRMESRDGISWEITDIDTPAVMHPADRELGQNAWAAGLTDARVERANGIERIMDYTHAKRLRSNDATYVYYREDEGRFEMYSVWLVPVDKQTHRVTPHDNAPQVLRTIHRRESEDGISWSDPEVLITADEHDPLHQQFYYLAVQPDGEWNIGMLGNYRCWEQTMDLELCFSRDGRKWSRTLRGGWIPRGNSGEIDHMSVYAPNRLIDFGDKWRLLYRAGNQSHNGELPDGVEAPRWETMAAEIPKGRFAGLSTTDRCIGSLSLKPFVLTEERISIDAEIGGRLRAELRDPFDRPVPGFELNSCRVITGNSHGHKLAWASDKKLVDYRYDLVGLRVEIEEGTIYSISV